MTSPSSPLSPVCWTDILANVQQALAQAEQEAQRSAALLDAALAAPPQAAGDQQPPLEEQFRQLANCVAQADQTAAATEACLQHSEEALRRWLALAEAIRRKLANGAGLSV